MGITQSPQFPSCGNNTIIPLHQLWEHLNHPNTPAVGITQSFQYPSCETKIHRSESLRYSNIFCCLYFVVGITQSPQYPSCETKIHRSEPLIYSDIFFCLAIKSIPHSSLGMPQVLNPWRSCSATTWISGRNSDSLGGRWSGQAWIRAEEGTSRVRSPCVARGWLNAG